MRIGFVGTGNMAGAMIRGMVSGGMKGSDIFIYDVDSSKMMQLFEDYGVCMVNAPEELAGIVELLLLVVKPQVLPSILPGLAPSVRQNGTLVVYIAAGKTIDEVQAGLGEGIPVVEVMPNLAAKVGESMSAFCTGKSVTAEHKAMVQNLFGTIGDVIELPESQLAAFTAIAGCSPAFLLMYIDALATAGVKCGMTKDTALRCAAQTVLGTTRMLQETGEHPRALVDQVCSPAGATIEGVTSLVRDGFEAAVQNAAQLSYERTKELSK